MYITIPIRLPSQHVLVCVAIGSVYISTRPLMPVTAANLVLIIGVTGTLHRLPFSKRYGVRV